MAINIQMPALSPTMEEGTLTKWLVKEGDTVASGTLLAEIETDKATMEFEAVDEGVIGKILVAEGTDNVKVGTVIAVLVEEGESLPSDAGAKYDTEIKLSTADIAPQVTWGTSPEDVLPITGAVPNPGDVADENKRRSMERALEYMGLKPGTKLTDVAIDRVFIGSCTNGRIEDLREVAKIAQGKKVASNVNAMVVPGSGLVKQQAEAEGLDKIFIEAGFEWREPGCSMCLAMNPDKLQPGERCASTSNRNFEGRQGRGGRTHLLSPAMAAAAAITGKLADVRQLGK